MPNIRPPRIYNLFPHQEYNTEYEPSGYSNSIFHVGDDILKFLFLHDFFMLFYA